MSFTESDSSWRSPIITLPLAQAFRSAVESGDLPGNIEEVKEFDNRKLVMTADRERLFAVVPARTPVIPHEEAVGMIGDTLKEMYGVEAPTEVVSLKNGAQLTATFELEKEDPITVIKGDDAKLRLVLTNSYDKSMAFKLRGGTMRLVCSNGAWVGDQITSLTSRDMLDSWAAEDLKPKVEQVVNRTKRVAAVWRGWSEQPVKYVQALAALDKRMPRKMLDDLLQPDRFPMNKWELYNILTAKATHETRTFRAQVAFDSLIASIFYRSHGPLTDEEMAAEGELSEAVAESEV